MGIFYLHRSQNSPLYWAPPPGKFKGGQAPNYCAGPTTLWCSAVYTASKRFLLSIPRADLNGTAQG